MNYKNLIFTALVAVNFMSHAAEAPKPQDPFVGLLSYIPLALGGLTAVSTLNAVYRWKRYTDYKAHGKAHGKALDNINTSLQKTNSGILKRVYNSVMKDEWHKTSPSLNTQKPYKFSEDEEQEIYNTRTKPIVTRAQKYYEEKIHQVVGPHLTDKQLDDVLFSYSADYPAEKKARKKAFWSALKWSVYFGGAYVFINAAHSRGKNNYTMPCIPDTNIPYRLIQ